MDPREWLFDKRVLRRNLDKGALTWKTYKEYLKGLDNQEEAADTLEIESRTRGDGAADGRDPGRSDASE